jgi:hypothetical protein
MTCHPEIDAWPRQGGEFIAGAGQGTCYADKTPEALATELYGALGRKYANDTFCGNKHI